MGPKSDEKRDRKIVFIALFGGAILQLIELSLFESSLKGKSVLALNALIYFVLVSAGILRDLAVKFPSRSKKIEMLRVSPRL